MVLGFRAPKTERVIVLVFWESFLNLPFNKAGFSHFSATVFHGKKLKKIFKIFAVILITLFIFIPKSFANISSKDYVDRIVLSSGFEEKSNKTLVINSASTDIQYPSAKAVYTHISDLNNPHAVTKAQVGLNNVQNVDQTNASNLTSGTVPFPRLPTGTVANTVATGDDARFMAVPTSQPGGTAPSGWAWIWISP